MATIAEMLRVLKEDVPFETLSTLNKGNNTIYYLSWYDLADLLDDRIGLGNWSWEVVSITTTDKDLFLTGKLTIFGDDRTLSQFSTGTEKLNCSSYGDASSNAESMAFRRAAAKFGVCRYLYDKERVKELVRKHKQETNQDNQTQANPHIFQSPPPTVKPTVKGEISREQWLAKFGKTAKQA